MDVTTYVLCSSRVKKIKDKLVQGQNVYQVHLVRLKDQNADLLIHQLEKKQRSSALCRQELFHLLLTPLMDGQMSQQERIKRSLLLIQNQQESLSSEDVLHMESVLFTLAKKFLKHNEMKQMKEVFNMSTLGKMLMKDGFDKGIKKGQIDGENRINRLNILLANANRIDDITKAARDKKYQRRLLKEFHL